MAAGEDVMPSKLLTGQGPEAEGLRLGTPRRSVCAPRQMALQEERSPWASASCCFTVPKTTRLSVRKSLFERRFCLRACEWRKDNDRPACKRDPQRPPTQEAESALKILDLAKKRAEK